MEKRENKAVHQCMTNHLFRCTFDGRRKDRLLLHLDMIHWDEGLARILDALNSKL
jgi:hypothetical protein